MYHVGNSAVIPNLYNAAVGDIRYYSEKYRETKSNWDTLNELFDAKDDNFKRLDQQYEHLAKMFRDYTKIGKALKEKVLEVQPKFDVLDYLTKKAKKDLKMEY
jgi:hypothetical protein